MQHYENVAQTHGIELERELDALRARTPMHDRPGREPAGLRKVGRWIAAAGERIADGTAETPIGSERAQVTIRPAQPGDSVAIEQLSELDERRVPRGQVIVAELDGAIIAATPIDGGYTVTDPRRPAGDVVQLLELRSRQLRAGDHELATAA